MVLSNEYKEVELTFSAEYSFNTMLKEILTNEEIKFYAKFSSKDSIVIVAKDKNDSDVYKTEIQNPMYFVKYFKVK